VQSDSLGSVKLVVVAPAGAVPGARSKLADCARYGWVLNPDGCGFRAGLQRALAALGLPLDIRLETFGRELQLQMVAEGVGLGLVPEPLWRASAWRERTELIAVPDFQPSVELRLLRARVLGRFEPPLAEFGACVAEALGLAAPPARDRRRA